MPAHPVKARLRPTRGHLQEGWSRGTPPAWRPRDETRAPDTLVDAIFGAIADAGSIPAVSTNFTKVELWIRQGGFGVRPFVVRGVFRPAAPENRGPCRESVVDRRQLGVRDFAVLPNLDTV